MDFNLLVVVTLPEPVKLREAGSKDDAKISDFQEELVQLAAALNGDYKKDTYPHKLVENMTCSEAHKYVEEAFKKFQDECEKARKNGTDESKIIVCENSLPLQSQKSFAHKIFSCLVCDN